MRIERHIRWLVLGLLIGALLGPEASMAREETPSRVMGTDRIGDWGRNVSDGLGPLGDALGQDLVSAAIGMADADTVEFKIGLNSLPITGGIPEISRYEWEFKVDGTPFVLDGRFTNYVRGTCDIYDGQCPPPRAPSDPTKHPFRILDDWEWGPVWAPLVVLHERGLVYATFDAETATISIPVPLELIDARPGSKIEPGVGIFGNNFDGNVMSRPAAWFTPAQFPVDVLRTKRTFVVPGASS